MITATLLNNMGTEHALNALRAELPDDLMWLVDWVERLQPSDDECAILEAVEEAGFTPASIAALGAAELDIENLDTTVKMIDALADADINTVDNLGAALALLSRLDDADINTVDELNTALALLDRLEDAGVETLAHLDAILEST
ncbi:MAG: hypothetical protein IPM06_21315 [Rhizobiales bacterium]|nr:hypothetical protein [Hyphomicrobiales bacterium]